MKILIVILLEGFPPLLGNLMVRRFALDGVQGLVLITLNSGVVKGLGDT